jgi:nucleotide-binding universal stress UspA family protein
VKVLLAVDPSPASRKAIEAVAAVFGPRENTGLLLTLLHVVESIPEFLSDRVSSGDAFKKVAEEWTHANHAAGDRLLSEARAVLERAGIPAGAIQPKVVSRESRPEARRVVAALAIIDEMREGGHNLVVVGRRGNSAENESLVGSVAEKVARAANGVSIWIVD